MSSRKVTYSNKSTHAARAAHARGEKEFRTYDTSAIRPKKSKAPWIALVAAIAVVVVIVIALFVNTSCAEAANDHLAPDGQQVTVQIAEGSTLPVIADNLYDAGLVVRKGEFTAAVNAKNAASSLQSGVYTFEGGMSNDDLVDALVAGPVANKAANLVVPEGATLSAIASAVESAYNGSITADQFTKAASNASKYVKDYPFLADAGKNSLEGFLFPKTYELIIDASAEDVVRQMLDQYQSEVASLDYSYPRNKGMSDYDALILASIVEKEATADTRTKVAAVFYNRLGNQGDPSYGTLGSDATTAYEVGDNLDNYNWSTKSPYNTRVTKGLPPTPICSPSIESLQAVLSPEQNFEDYYFFSFWTNDQGGVDHYFDKTYDDHQRTIAEHS